jgi:hypothetical protein
MGHIFGSMPHSSCEVLSVWSLEQNSGTLRSPAMATIPIGSTFDVFLGPFVSLDGRVRQTDLIITNGDISISKNAGDFQPATIAQTCEHKGGGWYKFQCGGNDTDTVGELLIDPHAPTALPVVWRHFDVVEPSTFQIRILDNTSSGFTFTSGFLPYAGQGHGGTVHYCPAGNGSETATWVFSGLPSGVYKIAATWVAHMNRATNAPFAFFDGMNALGSLMVNQELMPSDFNDAGSAWKQLATFTVLSGTLRVVLSNNANEYVIADAIRVERVS